MFDFVICGVFKNEAHILAEWIDHYLVRGVDHIFLVNDHSTDKYENIIKQHNGKVTLFHNDIETKDVGRQQLIYKKYFLPVLNDSLWAGIIDLDEFLYSPTNKTLKEVLKENDKYSQIKIDWLFFGSNGHELQPSSAVSGFTKRAAFTTNADYYSHKTLFKPEYLVEFNIHSHVVRGETYHMQYDDQNIPDLVINHYNVQSREFYMNVKATRGDVNNWFDSQKLVRDAAMFDKYDLNEVEDLRLFQQSKSSIRIHSINAGSDEVTLVITSCNRPHLLERTLNSFVATNTYPITRAILIDDSGEIGCNDKVVEKFKDRLPLTSLYNKVNIGQTASIDRVYSYVKTKWIFHCEEDWVFLQPGYIEKSMRVFEENPNEKIYTVWLRPHHSTSNHPIEADNLNRGYYMMRKDFTYEYNGDFYTWCGMTFNPGLRKTADCLKHHPYSICCEKQLYNGKVFVGEYTINKKYKEDGYCAMILADPKGHVDHIGWNDHIAREWD